MVMKQPIKANHTNQSLQKNKLQNTEQIHKSASKNTRKQPHCTYKKASFQSTKHYLNEIYDECTLI